MNVSDHFPSSGNPQFWAGKQNYLPSMALFLTLAEAY